MPLNLAACLGVLGGHGRVCVGEKRLVVAVEPILRRTQMSWFSLLRPRNEKRTGKFMAKEMLPRNTKLMAIARALQGFIR